jgi:hypothetical protein
MIKALYPKAIIIYYQKTWGQELTAYLSYYVNSECILVYVPYFEKKNIYI